MAITINSCHKPAYPPNPNSHISKSSTLAPCVGTSWRSKCVTTAACIVLGSAVGFSDSGSLASTATVQPPEAKAVQWSEKRKCPPWDNNYLERSTPEDLPRPLDRGKNNRGAVSNEAAPPLIKYNSSCFSM